MPPILLFEVLLNHSYVILAALEGSAVVIVAVKVAAELPTHIGVTVIGFTEIAVTQASTTVKFA